MNSLPDNTFKRLTKVIVRIFHLVGSAGLFGNAMMGSFEPTYLTLAIVSGAVLVLMDISSGLIWFIQLRAVSLYLKLLLLSLVHLYPNTAVPCLIAVIAISGFFSHAPRWIRYFSVLHWKVIQSKEDLLG